MRYQIYYRLAGCALGSGVSAGVCYWLAGTGTPSLFDALIFAGVAVFGTRKLLDVVRTVLREYL